MKLHFGFLTRQLLFLSLVVGVAVTLLSNTASADFMFGMGRVPGEDESTLLGITPDPFSVTEIGTTALGRFSGIDFVPGTNTLYASSGFNGPNPMSLFEIDATTGTAMLLGPINNGTNNPANDLAIDLGGTIFGAISDNTLAILDPITGQATIVGDFVNGGNIEGLAVDPTTDILYATNVVGELFQVDKISGFATKIGDPFNDQVTVSGFGIDASGTFYASSGFNDGSIYTFDTTSFTFVGQYQNGGVSDIAFGIPEPSSFALCVCGFVILSSVRRRLN